MTTTTEYQRPHVRQSCKTHSYEVQQRDGKPVLVCRCGKEMR